jgi:hypothetical protein
MQWTHPASLLAAQLFPNLESLKLSTCVIRVSAFSPLVQRTTPLTALTLCDSHMCQADSKTLDFSWPLTLLACTGFQRLMIWQLRPTPVGLPLLAEEPQLSTTLTHLIVRSSAGGPSIGRLEEWVGLMLRLPSLQRFYMNQPGKVSASQLSVSGVRDMCE